MTYSRKFAMIVTASAALSCCVALAILHLATSQLETSASEAKLKQIGYIINRLVSDAVWQAHADKVVGLGQDVAQISAIKSAVAAQDPQAASSALPELWRRAAVTSGEIAPLGATVHKADGSEIAVYAPQGAMRLPSDLIEQLANRQGNARFVVLKRVWLSEGAPRLSVFVPIGGLKLSGYLGIHVDPLHPLRGLDERLGMEISFRKNENGAELIKLEGFKLAGGLKVLRGERPVEAPGMGPVFTVAIGLDETSEANAMATVRTWSLVGLVFALALIGIATLLLVGTTSRSMARDEAMASAAELEARQKKEREALERHQSEARALEAQQRAELQNAVERERTLVATSFGTALERLAAKDLTCRLDSNLPAAYAKLQADFNHAVEQLEAALQSVSEGGGSIAGTTQEISTSAVALSRRTEQQAASLEETAAAIDEIAATGRKAAQGAEHAREVVSIAKGDAEKTGAVVRKTVEAIGAIEKSANEIAQIIGVIDEIAFQTNLLALNAGVEAARAGDAGRGFAVVASEVRGLAQRSAEAAKEIKALISTSTAQVSEGVELVAQTGKALERILAQVNDINKVVVDIAAGAQEQATGLQQVNTAINQMDQSTQQNAAMVEEATAASHALAQESSQLVELIEEFRLNGSGHKVTKTPATVVRKTPSAIPHSAKAAVAHPALKFAAAGPKSYASRRLVAEVAESDWKDF